MPSVLIETGFLSNPEEEKFLISQKGQQYISSAICRAFRKFKAKMEGNGKELASLNEKKLSPANTIVTPPVEQKVTSSVEEKPKQAPPRRDTMKSKENPKVITSGKTIAQTKKKPGDNPPAKDTLKTKSKTKVHVVNKDSLAPKGNLAANTVKQEKAKGKTVINEPGKTETVKRTPAKQAEEVVFRVQIATSPKELSTHSKKFTGLPDIWRYQHQGLFKYTSGKESSPEALAGLMGKAKKMGFTDAFIVAFHGTERITVAEAKKLILEKQK